MNKNLIFVGGGASSLIGAILIKEKWPDLSVTILEKNEILGKKLKATGSGRCNIAPISDDISGFYNEDFVRNTIGKISVSEQLSILEKIGIITKKIEGIGHYPVSESAANVVYLLERKLIQLGVKILNNCKVFDYKCQDNGYLINTNLGDFNTDYIVFANGGSSYASLGGEDTLSNVFIKHGYNFIKQKPVMTPISVKENIHRLNGLRLNCSVKLLNNEEKVYQECGEVQFRKDGLSGIVILNVSRYVDEKKKYSLSLDVLHTDEICIDEKTFVSSMKNNPNYLYSLISKTLIQFVLSRLNIDNLENCSDLDLKSIYRYLTNITLNVKSLFPLEYATVSRGGIDVKNIDFNFASKVEKNVFFLGEIIDVDGPCGGYSLRFAITSAVIFSKSFTY